MRILLRSGRSVVCVLDCTSLIPLARRGVAHSMPSIRFVLSPELRVRGHMLDLLEIFAVYV